MNQRGSSMVPFPPIAFLGARAYGDIEVEGDRGEDLTYDLASVSQAAGLPILLSQKDVLVIGEYVSWTDFDIKESAGDSFDVVSLGLPVGWGVFVALIMSILSASVGTAAAPSASLVLMNVVFAAAANAAGTDLASDQMIGMVAAMIALLMSIDPILDMFRTVVNVCGDSLCCLFLNDTDREEENAVAPAVE